MEYGSGLQRSLGVDVIEGGMEHARMNALLPNVKHGGGGLLNSHTNIQDRYGDAIKMIDECIGHAGINLESIQSQAEEFD